jgi:transcriptional regulator with XRE-family HTH domain
MGYDWMMSSVADNEFVIRGAGSFGAAIAEFRHRQNSTQKELADRANLHRSYLSGLESGNTTEALRNLVRALHALDLEIVIRPNPVAS